MPVTFDRIAVGTEWSRNTLAEKWGYKDFHALARGVITPAGDNKIILFITHEKQSHSEQYADVIDGDTLHMDGETNHGSDGRIIRAAEHGDEIHLFYREQHKQPFTYHGQIDLQSHEPFADRPSRFIFGLRA